MTLPLEPPPPPTTPPTLGGEGVPWERRGRVGAVQGLLSTASEALLRPTPFFRTVGPGPLGAPLIYAILVVLAAVLVQMLWDFVLPNPFSAWLPDDERAAEGIGMLVGLGFVAVIVPIFVPLAIFVMSVIYHGLLHLFGGPVGPFSATVRVTSYASSAQLAAVVPFCGSLIALVWGTVLQVIGLREAHGVSTGKAVAAVVVPFLLCAVVVLAGVALILATVAGVAAGSR